MTKEQMERIIKENMQMLTIKVYKNSFNSFGNKNINKPSQTDMFLAKQTRLYYFTCLTGMSISVCGGFLHKQKSLVFPNFDSF